MSWLAFVGPITGVGGLVVAVLGIFAQRRKQGHTEHVDGRRLGHEELVAALAAQRLRIDDLETERDEERQECREEVERWKDRALKAETRANELFRLIVRHDDS